MTPADLVGLLLLVSSLLLIWCHPQIRSDTELRWASFFTLGLHHCAAICNAFFFELRQNLFDAERFHRTAADPTLTPDTEYTMMLRQVYLTFGVSNFLGEELSVLAFAVSIFLFVYLAKRLGWGDQAGRLLLLYGALPSGIIHCSITLREPFQCLSFLGIIAGFVAVKERPRVGAFLGLMVASLGLTVLHQTLNIYVLLLLVMGITWVFKDRRYFGFMLGMALVGLSPVAGPKIYHGLVDRSAAFRSLAQGDLGSYAENYLASVSGAMAESQYTAGLDTSSLPSLLISAPTAILMFQLAPMPWMIRRVVDLYALSEVVLRLLLFWGAYRAYQSSSPLRRETILFMSVAALSLECMWALGTVNWGTASRHHLVSYPVWVLLGGSWLFRFRADREYVHLLTRRNARRERDAELCSG